LKTAHLKYTINIKGRVIFEQMSDLVKIAPFLKPYKYFIALNFIFNLLSVIFSLFSISLIIPVLGILFGTIEFDSEEVEKLLTLSVFSFEYFKIWLYNLIYNLIITKSEIYALGVICFFVIVFSLLKNITRYLALFFLTPLRNGVVQDVRNYLKTKLLNIPMSFFNKFKKGDMISRITNDVTEIEWSIIALIELILKDPIHIIIFLIGLSLINFKLTIICFLLFPITGFIIALIGKNLKKNAALNQKKISELISIIDQNISGIKIIKAFNKEDFILNIFKSENEKQKNIANKVLWKKDLSSPMSEGLSTVTMVIIIWIGGFMVLNNTLQAESFIGFTIMFSQIIPPTKSLTSSYYSIKKGSAALNRINEFILIKNEKENLIKNDTQTFNNEILFSKVNFSYNKKLILNNFSFSIKKGEKIAIVGESGCGKTTIIDLLLKFYTIDNGEIQIDSVNIENKNLSQLRSMFGLVSQDVFLFNDSIANNISLGEQYINIDKVIDASKKANAHKFISMLENKYETKIKNQGKNFSAGEKQRISIARAIYGDYPILIFDEATSSLDTKSTNHIQNIINNIGKGKTCIIISHKLRSVKNLDKIFVMSKGKIIAEGNHEFLINSCAKYQQLYKFGKSND
tara:strand:+ start:5056 stop:6945 length:1890 start_codon:yes stop_codon:yes gene_type:complete